MMPMSELSKYSPFDFGGEVIGMIGGANDGSAVGFKRLVMVRRGNGFPHSMKGFEIFRHRTVSHVVVTHFYTVSVRQQQRREIKTCF
jgi:hypothetical protein